MEQVKISDIFNLEYGNGLSLQKMTPGNIAFIARGSKNNGVSAYVNPIKEEKLFSGGKITVALSGSVLESFYHDYPFYTAYHVMVLTPKKEKNKTELLIYCSLIKANKYRYSYGRQANKTLSEILVPSIKEVQKIGNNLGLCDPSNKESTLNQKIFNFYLK